jgi:hypothetical protein
MRAHVFALCLSLFPMAAFADEPRNPAIETTIQNQLNAFIADDFATAFTFASPNIKGIFGTPENFGAMVTQGYPMVHRPAHGGGQSVAAGADYGCGRRDALAGLPDGRDGGWLANQRRAAAARSGHGRLTPLQ